jgi:CPA2 family monovalent cation:H+ antiporter-2
MPHHTSLIALLCMGFVVAFVLGLLAQRLRLPPLVGYLIAGIIVGPFTPGFVADQTLAPQLAEIGVILLMFGVGLHFSLRDLMAVKKIAIPGALAQITFVTLLGLGLARLLGWTTLNGLVFGLALSVASTVVVLRALEERRLLETRRGKIAIGWLIVEDLAMVLALVLLPAVAGVMGEEGKAGSEVSSSGAILGALAWTMVKVGAFVAVMLIVGRRVIPWILERVAGTGSRELFTLCVIAAAVGIAWGSSELFGVSFALGAFFAGMVMRESDLSYRAAKDSLPLRDAFSVLFFVSVGMLFDPAVLFEQPWLVLATLAIIVGGNAMVAFAVVRLLKLPMGAALTISVSLSQIGEFSFILAGLGLALEILPQDGHDLILAGALLSIIVNPFLFAIVDRRQAKQNVQEARDAEIARVELAELHRVPEEVADHAIVVGYGRVGSQLVHLLHDRGVPVVVIEDDADLIAKARAAGLHAVRGNAASERVMLEAAPERAKLAVFAIPNALEAGETIARLKVINPDITVLARAHSENEVKHLLAHGADGAVLAERELAYSLAEMVMATPPYRSLRAGAT